MLPFEVTLLSHLMMHRKRRRRPSAEELKADKYNELKRLRKKVGKISTPSFVPIQRRQQYFDIM